MNKSPEAEEKFKEISAAYEVIFSLVASAEVLKENSTRTR
jgi:curved DNA-binding protein CbpA